MKIKHSDFVEAVEWVRNHQVEHMPSDQIALGVLRHAGVEVETPRTDAERIADFVAALRDEPHHVRDLCRDLIREHFGVEP